MVDRVFIWFADSGNIRKWQREPFPEGTEFVSTISREEDPHEVIHVYEGDGGVIVRENGNVSSFGAQSTEVKAAFIAATITPAEVGGLVERLRKRADTMNGAAVGASDGATYTLGYYDQFAAADDREAATALAAKDAELAAVKANCETVCNSYADENQRLHDRAEAAEAQRDEAEKALEPFADIAGEPWADESGWTNAACQNDRICDWFGPSAFYTARRALGGKKDG